MTQAYPVKSQSSLYFERYARAEQQRAVFGGIICILGLVCAALATALCVAALRPRPIHYIAAVPVSGISYPGQVPLSSAASFTAAWVMDWMNYTPDTAGGVYERALAMVMPAFTAKIRAGLEAELEKIGRDRLASVFTLKGVPQCRENGPGFEAVFEGERRVYMGKEEMSREDVRLTVEVRRVTPTTLNPYGLAVEDFRKERAMHEKV
ncbi:MAG: TraE/TraK family type IV conjugative transfer system protein [Candidatus Omnitrophota bacterium]